MEEVRGVCFMFRTILDTEGGLKLCPFARILPYSAKSVCLSVRRSRTNLVVVIVERDPVGLAEIPQVGRKVPHAKLQPPLARRPFFYQLRYMRVLVDPSGLRKTSEKN